MNPVVSVVVPTCQRNHLLERSLHALVNQSFTRSAFEIVVVDDASSTATQQLVCRIARHYSEPHIRYLAMPQRSGPAAARNCGWQHARAEIIAFTDDDTIPDEHWLNEGLCAFHEQDMLAEPVDAVSGKTIVPISKMPTDYERNVAGLQNAEFITANCFLRREILERLGGFDENFKLAFREDCDLHFRLLRNGGRVMYAPNAVVVHPVREAAWGVSAQMEQKNMYDALLYKKHRQLYRERISRAPNWKYYGILGALLLSLFGVTTRRRRLALGAAATWAVMTSSFAAQRLENTAHTPEHIAEMVVTSALIPPLSIFWRIRGAIKYRVLFF